jgi:hypothetical protein
MPIHLHQGSIRSITAIPTDADGNAAEVETATWSTDKPDILKITVSADNPLIATVEGLAIGDASVLFDADGKIGEGEVKLNAFQTLHVVGADAVAVNLTVGHEA